MAQYTLDLFKPKNFSLAFEQMCNFAAIAKTRNADETLGQLILQSFVVFPKEKFQTAAQLADAIMIFGLRIPEYQIQVSLNHLLADGRLQNSADSNLNLASRDRAQLKKRIDEAKALEERVKQAWLENISKRFPSLPPEQAWKGLQGYLARTFRCHGLQTAALLDNSIDIAPAYSESIFSLLNESLNEIFSPALRAPARDAILSFFVDLDSNPEQKIYIEQLEDGVFHYFSLMVNPAIATRLQKHLNRLTLFLDTNFLFNILEIDSKNYYLEISKELVYTINKHRLPFRLRYHEETLREMREAITLYGNGLKTQEKTNFQRNGATPIDADTFLKRYKHPDILLNDQNITVHRSQALQRSQIERRNEHAELLEKYRQFLAARGRNKPQVLIDHDITVLNTVHHMRSKAKSTLEAEALFITCDYLLYVFDWETSQRENRIACTALPDSFLQVLQPFVPSTEDFDQSFEETFVIPEFRAIEGKSNEARTKMLSYLKAYESLPVETASQLLSNDLLLEPLRPTEDEQFHQYLETVLQDQKATILLEEKVAVEKQLEKELAEKESLVKRFEREKVELEEEKARAEREKVRADKAEQLLRQKERELLQASMKQEQGNGLSLDDRNRERQAREEAEGRAKEEMFAREKAERKSQIYLTITAITVSILFVGLFEFFINYLLKWSHPHGIGLQLAFDALLILFVFGIFHSKWRNWCWGAGAFAILTLIIQLLG